MGVARLPSDATVPGMYDVEFNADISQASALLFTSMIFSAERSRAIWKSSSIATLFHGLQGWQKDDLMRDRVEEIENDAKNMRVKLQRDEDGHLALLRE